MRCLLRGQEAWVHLADRFQPVLQCQPRLSLRKRIRSEVPCCALAETPKHAWPPPKMAALEAGLRGGSEQLSRCLLEPPADKMKAATQARPLAWCGAGTECMHARARTASFQADGGRRGVFSFLFAPPPQPRRSQATLFQNCSQLPREQGGSHGEAVT